MKYLHTLLIATMIASCSFAQTSSDWEQLFNKKDLTGWNIKITKHELNENFNNTFVVQDGILKVDYSHYPKFDGQFGHLYSQQPYSYYILRIEYRFTGNQMADGPSYGYLNSGVMLHSQSAQSMGLNQTFPVSLEMQFLAGDDKVNKTTGNLCTPGTEVSINNKVVYDHCINSTSKKFVASDWVTAEAVVMGDSIIHHIVNGDTVLTYTNIHIGGGFVSTGFNWTSAGFSGDSTLWIQQQGAPLKSGYIALQAESHPVEFRKVEILNLVGCMDKKALNYRSYFVKPDNSKCRY